MEVEQLLIAIHAGSVDDVRSLLKSGCDLNAQHEEVGTPLMFASAMGYEPIVKLLIAHGAAPGTAHPSSQMTAAHFAAANGHSEIVRHLLQAGASHDARDNQGWTPLMFAAQEGQAEASKILLAAGAAVDAIDRIDRTALMQAARCGRVEIARLLIDNGADVNAVAARAGWATPLIVSATAGQNDIATLLLDHGAEIDFLDYKEGYSALMIAACVGQAETVKLLLSRGATVNLQTEWSVTALTMARRGQHPEIEAILMAAGALEPNEPPLPVLFPWGAVGDPMLRPLVESIPNDGTANSKDRHK